MTDDLLREALERALGDRYEVLRLLGRGGMGAVYLARETVLDRIVAIKVLPPEISGQASSHTRERFLREAQTAAKLAHPNIVPLHAFGEADGLLYFVMGYVRGESLADRLRYEAKLPADDARRILAEVADALDYAHRRGIVHRDVKPDNILLEDESGRPMLADFGIARPITPAAPGGTLTVTGSVVGTPLFMSPEQGAGDKALDGRSDLYSLGAVGYTMVAGRPPFAGESAWSLFAQHATRKPEPLADVPGVPADLAAAIMKCLEKDPALRWPDGKSLRDALTASGRPPEDAVDALPGPLRKLTSWSSTFVIALILTLQFTLLLFYDGKRFLYALTAASLPLAALCVWFAIRFWRTTSNGYGWRRAVRISVWPPAWWPGAWPRSWRRPDDVWPRMPKAVQRRRNALLVPIFLLLAQFNLESYQASVRFAADVASSPDYRSVVLGWIAVTGRLALIGFILIALASVRWGRRQGVRSVADGLRLVYRSPTKKSFWNQPEIARLLLPARSFASPTPATEPRMPHEYLRAVTELAGQLTGPSRALGSEAIAAARQAIAAIGAQGNKMDDQRRDQLMDLLRTLWLKLATLRSVGPTETFRATAATLQVRAVCADIERYAAAIGDLPLQSGVSD